MKESYLPTAADYGNKEREETAGKWVCKRQKLFKSKDKIQLKPVPIQLKTERSSFKTYTVTDPNFTELPFPSAHGLHHPDRQSGLHHRDPHVPKANGPWDKDENKTRQ